MITITFEFEKDTSGYVVQCKELKGVISQGNNLPDAIKNITEALLGHLEAFGEDQLNDK